jgi:hypothetical protein
VKSFGSEIGTYLWALVSDLAQGKSFWVPVSIGLMAAIVGALAISTNSPRLVATVSSIAIRYQLLDTEQQGQKLSPDDAIAKLTVQIRDRLTRHLMLAFGEGANSMASSVEVSKDDLLKEKFLSGIGLLEVNVRVKVTNIGGGSSTINALRLTVVEEINGQRHPLERAPNAEIAVKIGQGQRIEITPEGGRNFYFTHSFAAVVDYETVRLLARKTGGIYGSDRSEIINPYLRLLALSDRRRQERLMMLADPQKRCRLLVVVNAFDILDRVGIGEAEILSAVPTRSEFVR